MEKREVDTHLLLKGGDVNLKRKLIHLSLITVISTGLVYLNR